MSKFIFILISFLSFSLMAAELGTSVQLRLKSPTGVYPNESGVQVKLQILSTSGKCVLREESFVNQSIVDGSLSLTLGSGSVGGFDPGLTLKQAFDNSKTISE